MARFESSRGRSGAALVRQRERTGEEAGPPSTRDRVFAQRRSRDTFERLLDAARDVFADKGFDDAQTPDIAERAGVSVGTFYRYFSDKRQAFIELITRHLQSSYEEVMSNLTLDVFGDTRTPTQRRAAVDHVIDVLFAHTATDPDLHRVFLGLSLRDSEVARIREDFETNSRRGLAALLKLVTTRQRIPDPEAAAQVIQIASQEVALSTTGTRGPAAPADRARALRSALAGMIYRYVFGEEPELPSE